jgi:hypothetical protein
VDLTCVVATFGDPMWIDLARSRAVPSAQALGLETVHVHSNTLHEARNLGLDTVTTEWVVHLDGDDELEPGFVEAMAAGTADVRAPSVAYVKNGVRRHPYMPQVSGHVHECGAGCLPDGNWLVVGSVARTDLLRDVGGWRDWPMYEDWCLWLRCHLAGASMEPIPAAVYRAHVRPDSRNRAPSHEDKVRVHYEIKAAAMLDRLEPA